MTASRLISARYASGSLFSSIPERINCSNEGFCWFASFQLNGILSLGVKPISWRYICSSARYCFHDLSCSRTSSSPVEKVLSVRFFILLEIDLYICHSPYESGLKDLSFLARFILERRSPTLAFNMTLFVSLDSMSSIRSSAHVSRSSVGIATLGSSASCSVAFESLSFWYFKKSSISAFDRTFRSRSSLLSCIKRVTVSSCPSCFKSRFSTKFSLLISICRYLSSSISDFVSLMTVSIS